MKRITTQKVTLKRVRPNALFEEWVTKLYEEAKLKNSIREPMLKEAKESLSKYPIPLKTGSECIVLKGFSKQLCVYLDVLLSRHNQHKESLQAQTKKRKTHFDTSISPELHLERQISQSTTNSTSDINQNHESVSSQSHSNFKRNIPIVQLQRLTNEELGLYKDKELSHNKDYNLTVSTDSGGPTNGKRGKNNSKTKEYEPAYRSGGYAILIALLEMDLGNSDNPWITKEELIVKAQKHSEESFTRPKPDSRYTAWSNMTRLITKGLVRKIRKKKVGYLLTEKGKELAKKIKKESANLPSVNDIIFNNIPSTSTAPEQNVNVADDEIPSILRHMVAIEKQTPQNINPEIQSTSQNVIEMPPGTYDIILLIDKHETGGSNKTNDPTVAQFNKYPNLKHEYRVLRVGDFTWIARNKLNPDQELVLPYIVERKRMDDLGASIKDGRYHEQKFRLRKCGLQNVIYMVENFGSNKHVGLPMQNLMQALANTRVQDGFSVLMTGSLTNSVRYLAMLTRRLEFKFKNKYVRGRRGEPDSGNLMTFDYFNKATSKTKELTVKETFIKMLLQLKGVSVEKALAITSKYPTPQSLFQVYSKSLKDEGQYILADLKYSDGSRNVGRVISKSIYQLFFTDWCSKRVC